MQKTWFITGAGRGLGADIAEAALRAGDRVAAAGRNRAAVSDRLGPDSERLMSVELDVNNEAQAQAGVAAAVARFGTLDVLVNNAGYGHLGLFEETTVQDVRAQFGTNLFGVFSVTRAVLPVMRAQRGGAIVNISSMGGQMSFEGVGAYSASKFALEGMSEALALEVKAFGIKVLIVEPGAFRTEFGAEALRKMPVMPAYQESLTGIRGVLHDMHGTQPGDPAKAARAVALALESDATPLRLQLGADAIAAVRTHAELLLKDLAAWERVGTDTALGAKAA